MTISQLDQSTAQWSTTPTSRARQATDLRDAAAKLVSSALVLPALHSLHESPLRPASGPFAPSSVEKRFAPLLELELADRITTAGNFSLVDSVVKKLAARSGLELIG